MEPLIRTLFELLYVVLDLYVWVLIIQVIASWLIAFGIVNSHNQFVNTVLGVLYRLTEPLLRPIRNLLPNMGGVDLSPLVLMLGVFGLQRLIVNFDLLG